MIHMITEKEIHIYLRRALYSPSIFFCLTSIQRQTLICGRINVLKASESSNMKQDIEIPPNQTQQKPTAVN